MTTNLQTIAARSAGLLAGMEPAAPRKVPDEFRTVADAWLEAYDSMSVSIRSGFNAAPPVKRSRRFASKVNVEVAA